MLANLVLVLVLGYLAVCALVYALQDRLVWFPGPPPSVDPGVLGLPHEEARITTEDGVALHGWFLPGGSEAVLVSHGNAGSVAERLPLAEAFLRMGRSVLLYDYRGYGRSEGRPDEEGTYRDAVAAFDWLVARGFASGQITAYGESLGAAVSVELARRREPARLVLEHAFVSVPELGAQVYPWLPVRLLSRIRYDSLADGPELRLPVLMVHSPKDDLVPIGHGRKLYAALPGPKRFLETRGGHNDGGFLQRAEWREAVRRFLDGED
jgi:fermentation-respiration switch protein FrsA (DUF1100 family)